MTYRNLVNDLRAPPSLLVSEDEFVARVMESSQRLDGVGASRESKSTRAIGITALAMAAAIAIVSVGRTRMRDQWTARGSSHHEIPGVSVQVLWRETKPCSPSTMRHCVQATELRFAVPMGQASLAFSRSSRWTRRRPCIGFTLATSMNRQNPTSIALEPNDTPRVLEEIVEPDRPAAGPFRVVALTSREPLSVRAIEKRLGGGAESIADLFPEGQVQEWRCTWASR